jgi:hypothetical protein
MLDHRVLPRETLATLRTTERLLARVPTDVKYDGSTLLRTVSANAAEVDLETISDVAAFPDVGSRLPKMCRLQRRRKRAMPVSTRSWHA